MGQRTQTIVRVTDKTTRTTTIKVYHDQWGIGRITPLKAMQLLNTFAFTGEMQGVYKEYDDITKHLTEFFPPVTAELDLHDLLPLYEHCDNNNGGMVIDLIRTSTRTYGKYGFVIGKEDSRYEDEAYSRLVPVTEWIRRTSNDILTQDPDFLPMWEAFCKWYDLKEQTDN